MDERPSKGRPAIEGFLILLCLICPGIAAAALMILSWSKPSLHAGLPMSTLGIPVWILILAGCCWFAGWIAVASVNEERKNREALKSALLMLLFQLALAPAIAFAVVMVFGAMF